ncbi:hypothetical protein PS662_02793 [Pseudomonas fluorescens]|uniref:Uncharacterized protein n=1 Tax=Pseudomonas fluorescens TaxID=294 RepID=A0A5E6TAN6_PSEFL|nr:hypothetical protein PS662_02793 [Pseudomonas fluorescens]
MSQKKSDQCLDTGDPIKKQQNQVISRRVNRLLL